MKRESRNKIEKGWPEKAEVKQNGVIDSLCLRSCFCSQDEIKGGFQKDTGEEKSFFKTNTHICCGSGSKEIFYRIIESWNNLGWKGLTRITEFSSWPCTEQPQESHWVSQSVIQTLPQHHCPSLAMLQLLTEGFYSSCITNWSFIFYSFGQI